MKPVLFALLPAFALAACGGSDAPASSGSAGSGGSTTAVSDAGAPANSAPAAEPNAVLASLGSEYANADLANGARLFRRCQSCHTLDEGGRHTVGPNLHGIVGRAAASVDRFNFSSQLRDSGLTWDLATLDAWIENPRALVPGNRMSFAGLRDAEARRDVIAYLAVETASE